MSRCSKDRAVGLVRPDVPAAIGPKPARAKMSVLAAFDDESRNGLRQSYDEESGTQNNACCRYPPFRRPVIHVGRLRTERNTPVSTPGGNCQQHQDDQRGYADRMHSKRGAMRCAGVRTQEVSGHRMNCPNCRSGNYGKPKTWCGWRTDGCCG